MHRRQFFIAAALIPFAAHSSLAAGPMVAPVDIVTYFYAFSAGKNGKWDGPSAFSDAGMRKTYFSKAFLAAIVADERKSQAAGDVGAIDFDPISASQDPSVKNLVVTPVAATADKATVKAHFNYEVSPKSASADVAYEFVREANAWKLDNIRIKQSAYPEGDDLRAMLAKGG